jgi:hypothetical protein
LKNLISFKVWFFERFAKPNRPKNMGASLGFFGLVRVRPRLSHDQVSRLAAST